jgi:hypothetical protein
MEVEGAVVEAQFRCLNFHAKWYKGGGAKLTIAVKKQMVCGVD